MLRVSRKWQCNIYNVNENYFDVIECKTQNRYAEVDAIIPISKSEFSDFCLTYHIINKVKTVLKARTEFNDLISGNRKENI